MYGSLFTLCYQPGMHVNGAPQMMQPSNMGVVPGPMPGPGPGAGPVGPPGNRQISCIVTSLTELVVAASSSWFRYNRYPDPDVVVDQVNSHLTTRVKIKL